MEDCLFCKIIKKEIPAKIYFEDKDILVFYDIKPKAPVHLLIVPKKHIPSLDELEKSDSKLMGQMVYQAKEIAKALNLGESGYRLVVNTGRGAGQVIFHLHFHLLGGGILPERD